ncbi:LuxR C-terminal-related transcriptional regulator [Sulfitobacter sp. PS-8MA]|uniref:helix-turn-helix transcriptional regulator n=1 Tax=Sulfitobacter sp. PS-8MA TaxID=3237707 RepID=UPI0034C6962C
MGALLRGTQAQHMLVYDTGDRRAINYSVQAADVVLSNQPSTLSDYNDLIRQRGEQSLDAQGSPVIHAQPPFAPILDEDLWQIDAAHEQRPEIQFTIDRLNVFRRFYVNLSEDPQSYAALITLYPDSMRGSPPRGDLNAVAALAPHLGKAMEIFRTLYGLRQKYQAVLTVLDMIAVPICIVDRRGHVLLQNRCAVELLGSKDGLWADAKGRLACGSDRAHRELHDAIRRISDTSRGERDERSRELVIPRSGAKVPIYAIASPLRDADIELEAGLTGALLTLIDGTRPVEGNIELVAAAYGLTPAETQVAGLMASGLSNPEISDRLNISPETVKTHVASSLLKTQCRNRLAFTWRVIQFSPPIL